MPKNNKMKYVLALVFAFVISIYLFVPIITTSPGYAQNIIHAYETESFSGNLKLLMANKVLLFKWFKCSILLFTFISVLLLIACHINSKKESGPISIPGEGTHGTARWMTEEEAKKVFTIKSGTPESGIIFGKLQRRGSIELKRSGRFETVALSLPVKSNKNVGVYGAAGTGKSRAFVRNQILQIAKMGQSMVITDPKAELFEDMTLFLKDQGYNVKVLNLVHMIHSDRWNPLAEVTDDISAQSFAETVMANTRTAGGKVDEFWDKSEMNLLKALVLYVVTVLPKEDRNLATVYSMLATKDVLTLDAMFAQLDYTNPAKMPYAIYSQASDKIKPNIVIGLGSKLQIFQNEIVQNLTATSDIDLMAPKYEKTAYFCIISDSESTFDFVAGLFFSFLFMKLTKYADFYKDMIPIEDQQEVYFILDEFPNIGAIPDFTKKISTLRSRGIICFVIFQNIAQLQNRYPNNGWLEILGNCDSQLFLGASDDMTAKQVSDHMGISTVETHSENRKAGIEGLKDFGSKNTSSSKRNLLNPDELLKLDKRKAVLMQRGYQPLMLYKMDYSEHEMAGALKSMGVRNYKLMWAEKYYPAEEEMIEKARREAQKRKLEVNKKMTGFEIFKKKVLFLISKILKVIEAKINYAAGSSNKNIAKSHYQKIKESTADELENGEIKSKSTGENKESDTDCKCENIQDRDDRKNTHIPKNEKSQIKLNKINGYSNLSENEIEKEICKLEKLKDKKARERETQLNFLDNYDAVKSSISKENNDNPKREDNGSFW